MFMLWLIFEVMLVVNGLQGDDEWIDPTDMLNYDAAAGTMRRPQQAGTEEDDIETRTTGDYTEVNQGKDCSDCERQLDNVQKRFEECRKKTSAESTEISCNPVFKRYLNKLLLETGKLGLPGDNHEVHYDAEILVTKQDVTEIKKFLSDKAWKAGALDDALSKILINFKFHDHERWKWRFEDTFHVDPFTAITLLAMLMLIVIIFHIVWTVAPPFTRPYRFFLLCFLISFVWNWVFLYKTAFAKRQANFAKLQLDKPMCTGVQNMDWKGSLLVWFRQTWTLQNDPCEMYYEALLVDPILEVPPTKAFMLTVTTLITEPLKHIGEPISHFFRDLLKDLPWIWQFPVTLTVILAVVAFCYSCGHAVVRYSLSRSLPHVGPQAPIAHHNVPYSVQGSVDNTLYQSGGYVDYQAGGDANYFPHIRRDPNHDAAFGGPSRRRDLNDQGVEDLKNWERAEMVNNGQGDNHLRRRKVPYEKDYHCARYSSDQLVTNKEVIKNSVPQPSEENPDIEDVDIHQAQEIVEQWERNNFQNKKATELPVSKFDNQLHKVRRAGEDMQSNVPEEFGTKDRPLDAVSQLPSGMNVTEMSVTEKKQIQEKELENELPIIENVGVQEKSVHSHAKRAKTSTGPAK
ncbi:chloride channel CLIC-like protein 1 isoform X1 [Rhincodon typus]|uniref:chloride channel CLIC-like protein 1 isoform X1 n=1 Tax=Rhincodon typus TaxID=259920 RepID=UPI00202DE0B3|nr:chloride channel CLIC-like protein 1 isoform X1 [Rhincodon typus]